MHTHISPRTIYITCAHLPLAMLATALIQDTAHAATAPGISRNIQLISTPTVTYSRGSTKKLKLDLTLRSHGFRLIKDVSLSSDSILSKGDSALSDWDLGLSGSSGDQGIQHSQFSVSAFEEAQVTGAATMPGSSNITYAEGALAYSSPLMAAAAEPVVVTYGFELDDIAEGQFWEAISDGVGIIGIDNDFGVSPTEGDFQAFIEGGGTSFSELRTFFGITQPAGNPNNAFDGAGLKLSDGFAADAGDLLTFDWRFEAGDFLDGNLGNDFAFFVLDGEMIQLGSVEDVLGDAAPENWVGYVTMEVPITTNNSAHTLGFGVVNGGDGFNPSWLHVDNIKVHRTSVIPEPGTGLTLLVLTGLWAHTAGGRRAARARAERQRTSQAGAA